MKKMLVSLLATMPLIAEGTVSFRIGQKHYHLTGAQAAIRQRQGKTQLVIGLTDKVQRVQFSITVELAELVGPVEISTQNTPLNAMILTAGGAYTAIPHTTLARDHFLRYVKKEEYTTGEWEEDPDDRPEERIEACRKERNEECLKLAQQQRRRRPKVKVRYTTHGPTWLGKSREQRIAEGDGVMVEEKYRDTAFVLRLTPVIHNGKIERLTGNFAGIMLFQQGMQPAQPVPVQAGNIDVAVQLLP